MSQKTMPASNEASRKKRIHKHTQTRVWSFRNKDDNGNFVIPPKVCDTTHKLIEKAVMALPASDMPRWFVWDHKSKSLERIPSSQAMVYQAMAVSCHAFGASHVYEVK